MIECVPNVSEGRDPDVIHRIAEAIEGSGCHLLDVHSDPDHNRSVYTMVGDEQQIYDGAIALARSAIALIHLCDQRGVHPRIGAIDVIPVVPIQDTSMPLCVTLARRIGEKLGNGLGLPVFLYGEAARSEYRASLPWIRRGGAAGLERKLIEDGPDYGPRRPHISAGAVAVGARGFLVAFNVVLNTTDVSVAQAIASVIRETGGGLPGVRALGLSLASRALSQVSMNLIDIASTDILAAFRAVQREATLRGVDVLESEIVGLIPRVALGAATAADLHMREDPKERFLESRIAGLA